MSVQPNVTKLVKFEAEDGRIEARIEGSYTDGNALSNITIMGLMSAPTSTTVTLNGKDVGKGIYNANSKTFFIGDLDSAMKSGAWVADWTMEYGAGLGGYDLRGVAVPWV